MTPLKIQFADGTTIDLAAHRIGRGGQWNKMTTREHGLLSLLIAKAPSVVAHQDLMKAGDIAPTSRASLYNAVVALNKKTGDAIVSHKKAGYAWRVPLQYVEPRRGDIKLPHDDRIMRRYIDQAIPVSDRPIRVAGRSFRALRDIKRRALEERLKLEARHGVREGALEWERVTRVRAQASGHPVPWNRVSFYLSEALQLLGLAAYTGQVSLAIVLINLGDAVVDDWLVCERWVHTYRAREAADGIEIPGGLPYHRRHAEWLAIAAALYMHNKWGYARATRLLDTWGGTESALARLKALSELDAFVLGESTGQEINALFQ